MPSFKPLIAFCLLLIAILFIAWPWALTIAEQPSALERVQTDYNLQFTKYRDLRDEYTKAKASYFTFKTAVAKNDAYVATKNYLTQIDQLYKTFIALTVEHGNTINWSGSTIPKDDVTKILAEEKAYLDNYKQKLENAKTLEELPPLADELESHIKDTLEPKLNKTLAVYEVSETESALADFNNLSRILDRVVVFKLRAGETKSILANWDSEIKDIRDKTTEALSKARNELLRKKESTAISKGELETISTLTQKAKGELKRSKPLFEELIRIL